MEDNEKPQLTPEQNDLNTQASFIVALNQLKLKYKYETLDAQALHGKVCILIDKINNYMLTTK